MNYALSRSATTCLMITDATADEAQRLSSSEGRYIVVIDPLDGTPNIAFTAEVMGVNFFTMDPGVGEFFLANEDVRIPEFKKAFSMNTGRVAFWSEGVKAYLEHATPKQYGFRYAGSMVSDIHRILMEGGLFAYPSDLGFPNGKLHLMYKCNPLALIVEKAGGAATDGSRRILDIQPLHIHQTTPIFIGSPGNVSEAVSMLSN